MKKFSLIILLTLLLSCVLFSAHAEESETLDYTQMSDIERLARGIIYVPDNWTLADFCEQMEIIDDSDGHFYTQKFAYFCYAIEQLYYIPMTADEVFRAFADKNPYVDINDIDKVYHDLFSVLDKYSYYLPPEMADRFWNSTTSKGIGVTLVYDATGEVYGTPGTYVEGVSPNSSAADAGILPGDRLVSLEHIDTRDMTFPAVSAILSSTAEKTHVELMYERVTEDEIITGDVTLERRNVVFREVTFHLYPKRHAFVMTLDSFANEYTHVEILNRLKELRALGYTNAIIDLRGNHGGDVYIAANIINNFVKEEGQVLFTMGREGKLNYQTFVSSGIGIEFDSLYVLVNEESASSAEITALCLEQHADAILIGTKTKGKGVAQSAGQIIDDSTFGITTFVAYDHLGKTYNEKGLLPRLYVRNNVKKYELPSDLEWFNYINYVEAVEGAENKVVTALERRLEIMGFLKSEYVDGLWDKNTTNAVIALQLGEGLEPTGALTDKLVIIITDIINAYKDYYYTEDIQLETALSLVY